jgi:hypothetical protein
MASQASGPLERDVQRTVRDLFERVGVKVGNHSQFRPSNVHLGTGDLYLRHPRFRDAWFETKREGGEQSLDQETFEAACKWAGVHYVIGGKYEALRFLESVGLWRLPAGVEMSQVATPTTVHRASERIARAAERKAKR